MSHLPPAGSTTLPTPAEPQPGDAQVSPEAPPRPRAPTPSPGARSASLLDFDALSIEAKNLNAAAATDLPRDSSTLFSFKLLSHLEVYWEERRYLLALDARGEYRVDYARIFRSLNALLDEPSGPYTDDEFIRLILEQAVLIEPNSFSYFVQGLGGAELMFLGAYHDLAMAMVCYKAAARVTDPVQRRMLFEHTDGALEKLWSTRRRFENVRVPTVIRDYAEAITLKIKVEMARKVPP